MEQEYFFGPMDPNSKDCSQIIISMAKEFTNGLTGEGMKANGKIIKCKEKEFLRGKMVENTLGNIMTIKSTVMVSSFGQMGKFTKETGQMENSMGLGSILAPIKMKDKENGLKEKE